MSPFDFTFKVCSNWFQGTNITHPKASHVAVNHSLNQGMRYIATDSPARHYPYPCHVQRQHRALNVDGSNNPRATVPLPDTSLSPHFPASAIFLPASDHAPRPQKVPTISPSFTPGSLGQPDLVPHDVARSTFPEVSLAASRISTVRKRAEESKESR